MKNLFLIVGLLSLMACNSTAQNIKVKDELLPPNEFKMAIQNTENYYLIDVRTPAEFNNGHIEDAENLNLMDKSFENAIENMSRDKTVFVYCAKGGRSARAAELLKDKGFSHIIDLKGGFTAWKKQ